MCDHLLVAPLVPLLLCRLAQPPTCPVLSHNSGVTNCRQGPPLAHSLPVMQHPFLSTKHDWQRTVCNSRKTKQTFISRTLLSYLSYLSIPYTHTVRGPLKSVLVMPVAGEMETLVHSMLSRVHEDSPMIHFQAWLIASLVYSNRYRCFMNQCPMTVTHVTSHHVISQFEAARSMDQSISLCGTQWQKYEWFWVAPSMLIFLLLTTAWFRNKLK